LTGPANGTEDAPRRMRGKGSLGAVAGVVACGLASAVACGARSGLPYEAVAGPGGNPPGTGGGSSGAQPGADASVTRPADGAADVGRDAPGPIQCLASSHQTNGVPTDLYFMVDRSGSMNTIDPGSTTSRWFSVLSAMGTFLAAPDSDGLGAGLAFFPISTPSGAPDCTAADYAVPVEPIGLLPSAKLLSDIAGDALLQVLGRGTPATPALQGAYSYTQTVQRAEPNRNVAVLLVTDGNPIQCGSTLATAAAAASVGAAGSAPIRTYVLGIGPSLTNLNDIAQAGGTGHAYLVESGGAAALTTALNAIRADSISCDYVLPPLGGAAIDGGAVSVEARVGFAGASTAVGEVAAPEACGAAGGWYFDDPVRPARVTLCPAICASLEQTSGSALDILVDCN
jgi:von Willebrand factor type A domain